MHWVYLSAASFLGRISARDFSEWPRVRCLHIHHLQPRLDFQNWLSNEEHKESQTAASLIRDGDRFIRASHLLCCHLLKERGLSIVLLSHHPLERACSSDDDF